MFSFWNQGPEPRHGRVYPSVLRCVLCVCDLWPLLMKQHHHCGMFLGGRGRRVGTAGIGMGCLKAKWLLSGCRQTTALSSICTQGKEKKKKISNWNFWINCPLCCLQLTVMLQMKPFEKSHFWLHVYWRKSLKHLHLNVYWCAFHSWLSLVAVFFSFLGTNKGCRPDISSSRMIAQSDSSFQRYNLAFWEIFVFAFLQDLDEKMGAHVSLADLPTNVSKIYTSTHFVCLICTKNKVYQR